MGTLSAAAAPARRYFATGLSLINRRRGTYALLTALYVAPALLAALLAVMIAEPNIWQQALLYLLRSITVVLGTLAVMVMVSFHAQGREIGIARASWLGLHWVFRYLWTNAHTSLIFWVPTTALLWLHARQGEVVPLEGGFQPLADGIWWIIIGVLALAIHTRTMLAPFLAVHGDLPGTLATTESWRLGGRSFRTCLSTLVLASAPIAIPLSIAGGGLLLTLPSAQRAFFLIALPDLTWAAIQLIRPLLIPAVYALYKDLWEKEAAGRTAGDVLATTPKLARPLLALTRPLPHFGRWE
ncbi:MAG: hypothetical protein OXK81_00865 [Chloroflexota bacterium]|nr:hypothetical protein [Chloroflexota bacterium]MDE2930134.1 hypothetical protein [Chloroflexota bacterium]